MNPNNPLPPFFQNGNSGTQTQPAPAAAAVPAPPPAQATAQAAAPAAAPAPAIHIPPAPAADASTAPPFETTNGTPEAKGGSGAPEAKAKKIIVPQIITDVEKQGDKLAEDVKTQLRAFLDSKDLSEKLRYYKTMRKSVLILGPPGCGKSDAMKQVSDWAGDEWFYDFRLGLYEPTDVAGLPYAADIYDPTNGRVIDTVLRNGHPLWLPPTDHPVSLGKARGTVVLDEINVAPVATMNAALQLLKAPNGTTRMCGPHPIPDTLTIFAAGNRGLKDVAHTNTMGEPLRDRFAIYEFDYPSAESWTRWAYANNIDRTVIAFLNWKKEALFMRSDSDFEPPATPRGWSERVSPLAAIGVEDVQTYAAQIGQKGAEWFVAYLKELRHMPDVGKLLDGTATYDWKNRTTFGITFAILTDLVMRVFEKPKLAEKAAALAVQAEPEHATIFVMGVYGSRDTKVLQEVVVSPTLKAWAKANRKYWDRITKK